MSSLICFDYVKALAGGSRHLLINNAASVEWSKRGGLQTITPPLNDTDILECGTKDFFYDIIVPVVSLINRFLTPLMFHRGLHARGHRLTKEPLQPKDTQVQEEIYKDIRFIRTLVEGVSEAIGVPIDMIESYLDADGIIPKLYYEDIFNATLKTAPSLSDRNVEGVKVFLRAVGNRVQLARVAVEGTPRDRESQKKAVLLYLHLIESTDNRPHFSGG